MHNEPEVYEIPDFLSKKLKRERRERAELATRQRQNAKRLARLEAAKQAERAKVREEAKAHPFTDPSVKRTRAPARATEIERVMTTRKYKTCASCAGNTFVIMVDAADPRVCDAYCTYCRHKVEF